MRRLIISILLLTYILSLRYLFRTNYGVNKIVIYGKELQEIECPIPTDDSEEDLKWWRNQPESPDPLMASCPIHRLSYSDMTGKLHVDPKCISPEISTER